MKKFLSLLCMITCVFGLTACGSTEALTEFEQAKVNAAIEMASAYVIPSFESFKNEAAVAALEEYTADEVTYAVQNTFGFEADGYAYLNAIESFNSGYEDIGNLVSIGDATAEIQGDQIVVRVAIQGEKDMAEAEIVFTNDMFMRMESAALNPVESMGDMMVKAGMNTLIGVGTVFAVLLLMICVISAMSIIPKIQAKMSKKDKEEVKTIAIENAVAQITTQEESEVVNLTEDYELVAVIAAAIAASQGATSTDGFVVRSIRKVRRK